MTRSIIVPQSVFHFSGMGEPGEKHSFADLLGSFFVSLWLKQPWSYQFFPSEDYLQKTTMRL